MNTKPKPLISFVIPLYNQGQFLYDALASIQTSYLGPKEIIIVDDCSTDPQTARYLDEVKACFSPVKVFRHEQNKGLSAARNTGIRETTGEFVQMLDADDILIPGKIDVQLVHLSLSNKVDISITNYMLGNEDLTAFTLATSSIGSYSLTIHDFLFYWERGLSIPIHAALFPRRIILQYPFVERMRAKEDWIFWCQLANEGFRIGFLNLGGVVYRQHESAMTKSSIKKMGEYWCEAAKEINQFLKQPEPEFMKSSLAWYEEIYKNKDDFKDNDSSSSLVVNTAIADSGTPCKSNTSRTASKQVLPDTAPTCSLSVFIPVYNHYQYLPVCFDSVINQINNDMEIIIIDDHSTDVRIRDYLQKLARENPRIRVFLNDENFGISAVSNQGVREARGEYIAFLDCDDYLAPNAISTVFNFIHEQPDVDYFFSDRMEIDDNNHIIRRANYGGYKNITPSGNIGEDLRKGMIASHLKVVRKSKILEVNGFNELLSGVQDWDLAVNIAETGKFFYIPQPLYYYRVHSRSVTSSAKASQFRKTNLIRRRLFAEHKKHHISQNDLLKIVNEFSMGSIDKDDLHSQGGTIIDDDFLSYEELNNLLETNRFIIYDARKPFSNSFLDFLKEFNSYFDAILCNDPRVMASLLPFLWNVGIINYPWKELNNSPK